RATLKFTVIKKGSPLIPKTNSDALVSPFAETEKYWIPLGLSEDLDEAMKIAVRESIGFLSKQLGIDRRVIYAYLSAAVDYEVSQVVDKTKGIHALVPKVDFVDYLNLELKAGTLTLPVSVVDGIFYVPAEKTVKALGLKYSEKNNVITIAAPTGVVTMTIDSNRYLVGKENIRLAVAPVKTKEGVLLPVSLLGDLLGASVAWTTEATKIVGQALVL
ncbi:MAG: acetamidase, partial [Candidatus Accumulibacter sp.]|nr:acetamidase [Accumulibacter sp.]